jgi:hypothetical protein
MGKTRPEQLEEAKQLARVANKVMVVIGLTFMDESEGFDRASYGIAPGHR